MKKSIKLLLIFCICITFLCGCNNKIEITENEKDLWGINMTTGAINENFVSIKITYDGTEVDGELDTGAFFDIEKYNEETSKWISVAIAEVSWDALAYIIKDGKPLEMNCPLEFFDMSKGNYRVVKRIMLFKETGNYEEKNYYAEFNYDKEEILKHPRYVKINNQIYKDTNTLFYGDRTADVDGFIMTNVSYNEMPTNNDESNFGIGYAYTQLGEEEYIVCIENKDCIFKLKRFS